MDKTEEPGMVLEPKPLYAMMNYSDNESVTIVGFHPINLDGTQDVTRDNCFRGQVNILTNAGPVPHNFNFPPEVTELSQAVKMWKSLLEKEIENLFERLKSDRIRSALLNASGKPM